MPLLRARIQDTIVTEFLPPADPRTRSRGKVMILCDGMPSVPAKREVLEFFARRNYWVFHPRYRGSWESEGTFLEHSPADDISLILDALPKGIRDAWSGDIYEIEPRDVTVCGTSFGGTAALLSGRDPRVNRTIALSPVVDWRVESPKEPLDWMYSFVTEAFGNGYRMNKELWNKLRTGTFFNPVAYIEELRETPMLIFHGYRDEVVPIHTVQDFADRTGARLITRDRGGHFSVRAVQRFGFRWHIRTFLNRY